MTAIKERIIGAVTVMSDEKANRLWDFIEYGFDSLDDEDLPADDDFEIAGTYQSMEDLLKGL